MMKQITVIIENKIGALASITDILGRSGINIVSISAQGFENTGIVRILTPDIVTATNELSKAGFNAIVSDVIILKMLDKPGELFKTTKKLSKDGVNIRSVYIIGKDNEGRTEVVIDPEDYSRALKIIN
jgi:hypothetical protein